MADDAKWWEVVKRATENQMRLTEQEKKRSADAEAERVKKKQADDKATADFYRKYHARQVAETEKKTPARRQRKPPPNAA